MPYIGAKELKASDIRRFDVTGSTNAGHTLTWTPPNEQSLIVTINGVKQHGDSYSVSGNTLTLSSSLVATDKLEVIGINDIGTTITPAQNSVDTDKIVDDAVTSAKLANAINITSGNSLTIDSGATITNNGTASGFGSPAYAANASASTGAVNIDASDNLQFDSGYGSTATAYGCRAWVNFNGTGTVAIRGSGNVSSITDNGVGDYDVNFTTAMPDLNYCTAMISGIPLVVSSFDLVEIPNSTSNIRVRPLNYTSSTYQDTAQVMVMIFR